MTDNQCLENSSCFLYTYCLLANACSEPGFPASVVSVVVNQATDAADSVAPRKDNDIYDQDRSQIVNDITHFMKEEVPKVRGTEQCCRRLKLRAKLPRAGRVTRKIQDVVERRCWNFKDRERSRRKGFG